MDVTIVVSDSYSLPNEFINLERIQVKSSLLKVVSREMMKRYCIVPLDLKDGKIFIAMSNPNDKKAIEDLKVLTQKDIVIYRAKKEQVLSVIEELDNRNNTLFLVEQFKKEQGKSLIDTNLLRTGKANIESSPVVEFSNLIISQAIMRKASDIHMEPYETEVIIRFRVDGSLEECTRIPKESYTALCTRFKIKSGMDISEKRLPQDGKIDFEMDSIRYDLRVSSLPTINGEKFVIRILYKKEHMLTLENLGFLHRDRELLKNSLDGGSGLILFSGPTGSGKTTTLYSLLNQMDRKDKNIITIEDPVEYVLPGISQVNVSIKAGLTFAAGLRSVLRQDPDVILIGEIRDEETAQIAIRAAITGHLVLSTVHTNDAATTILRLIDMGIPRYLVADAISICVSQRLVRKICENCKTEYSPSLKEIASLSLEHSVKLYRGEGCILCNNTGYSGRTVVYEIIGFDDKLRRLVVNCKNIEEMKRYNEEKRVVSLRDCCKKLTMDGTTTYQEYLRLCSSYI